MLHVLYTEQGRGEVCGVYGHRLNLLENPGKEKSRAV